MNFHAGKIEVTLSPSLRFDIIIRAFGELLPLLSVSVPQSRVSSTEQEHGLPADYQGLIPVGPLTVWADRVLANLFAPQFLHLDKWVDDGWTDTEMYWVKPGSPALQAVSLLSESPGKPLSKCLCLFFQLNKAVDNGQTDTKMYCLDALAASKALGTQPSTDGPFETTDPDSTLTQSHILPGGPASDDWLRWDDYWVGQKVRLGFSVECYRKIQTNFSANPMQRFGHFGSTTQLDHSVPRAAHGVAEAAIGQLVWCWC